MDAIRVRFAPAPTGLLHIGNAHTALFNWLFARHNRGAFILRIDDTDRARFDAESERAIYISLKWLGLDWDEGPVSYHRFSDEGPGELGPYRQSERLPIYSRHLDILREKDFVYPCFCTHEQLEQERRDMSRKGIPYRYSGRCANLTQDECNMCMEQGLTPVWRFRTGRGEVSWHDCIRGRVSWRAEQIGDFVIQRASGIPTYNFTTAVDDHQMGISHVIRGDDHLANAPRQVLIHRALGWQPPQFAHLPLITGPDRKPLSKRHGVSSLDDLYSQGFLPEAVVNYLARIGWSSPSGKEVMDREHAILEFTLERVNKSPAAFDMKKLEWINGKHLRDLSPEGMLAAVKPYIKHAGMLSDRVPDQWLKKALLTVRDNLHTCTDAVHAMKPYLVEPPEMEDGARSMLSREKGRAVVQAFLKKLDSLEDLDEEAFRAIMQSTAAEAGVSGKDLYMPVRAAVSGSLAGPELPGMLSVLGRERVKKRLELALSQSG